MAAADNESDRPRRPRSRQSALRRHFAGRVDPLTSALLVFPLFALYQLGILSGRGQNGVDFVTSALIDLVRRDLSHYVVALVAMCTVYVAVLVLLGRRQRFHPRAFLPVLAEATFLALIMGSLILFVMHEFLGALPGLAIAHEREPLDVLVISAGAGFHEELIFRVILMGGLAWILTGLTGRRRAWIVALVLSSVAFSLAHHVGPAGEAFAFSPFVYRTLAGVFFATVYQVRGFAVAAWTHALYDVYVLTVG